MARDEITRIGAIGAGSWGTALANLLAEQGHTVDLWVREEDVYEEIKRDRINRTFLPDVELVPDLNPVKSYEDALADKDLVMMVVPSHVFRDVLTDMKPFLCPGVPIIAATKGIENDGLMVMSQVAEDVLPKEYTELFACLAGPSFAKEVVRKHHAERLQRLFNTDYFRVYITDDLIGVQLCGALKNVIAIAAGAADGLGSGLGGENGCQSHDLCRAVRDGRPGPDLHRGPQQEPECGSQDREGHEP